MMSIHSIAWILFKIFITLPLSLNAAIASNGMHWSYVTLFELKQCHLKKSISSRDPKLKIQSKNFKQTVLRILISRDVSLSFETSIYSRMAKKQRCSCCLFSICVYVYLKAYQTFYSFSTYMFNVSSGICLELAAKFHCLWLQYFVGYAPRLYIFI